MCFFSITKPNEDKKKLPTFQRWQNKYLISVTEQMLNILSFYECCNFVLKQCMNTGSFGVYQHWHFQPPWGDMNVHFPALLNTAKTSPIPQGIKY